MQIYTIDFLHNIIIVLPIRLAESVIMYPIMFDIIISRLRLVVRCQGFFDVSYGFISILYLHIGLELVE